MNFRDHGQIHNLPSQCFSAILTARLKNPEIAWAQSSEAVDALAKNGVYCLPQDYEPISLYDEGSNREEAVDIYGGDGVGYAGGSGRCSIYNGTQTKGVGRTPLVALNADFYHASGTMSLEEACQEAIFSEIYRACLPFGVLETLAVVLTGGKFIESFPDGTSVHRRRALIIRPFTVRPAHFLRNVHFSATATTPQSYAAGLTADAHRVYQTMPNLPSALALALGLHVTNESETDIVYLGLQELGRRYAHQLAASFAKRLPHGSLSCSNLALNGAYLDFGVSSYVPDYRRQARSHNWTDPWTEKTIPLKTLNLLWAQYLPRSGSANRTRSMADFNVLGKEYEEHYDKRITLEMIKMTGLPEDLANQCPTEISKPLFLAMKKVWTRGAHEQYVSFPASAIQKTSNPPPRAAGRYKLNKILSIVASARTRTDIGKISAQEIDDPNLSFEFCNAYAQLRGWLDQSLGESRAGSVNTYLQLQASRKNKTLEGLSRRVLQAELREAEAADSFDAGKYINEKINEANYILSDLHPDLPGQSSMDQLNFLANGWISKISPQDFSGTLDPS